MDQAVEVEGGDDDILAANAEMARIVLQSALIRPDDLNHCLRLIEKDRLKGGRSRELLSLLVDMSLIDETQKRALEKAAERFQRERETSRYRVRGYSLIRKIGGGGLGVVYQARQLSMRRMVALKILHEKWAKDDEFRSRFMLEARVMGRLSHQNLVQVFDVGREENLFFFSMEYVDGPTVEQMIKRSGRMNLIEALEVAVQVARAINYIAGFDIVHRDIKPANIMLTRASTVKLADFGFLLLMSKGDMPVDDGYVVGTPDYISPEQASGKKVDFRSDMYSLGVSLYHMLSGRVPYVGTVSGVMRQHVSGNLPERSTVDGETIPPQVYNVICKMMAKDPDDRYSNIPEMLDVLQFIKSTEIVKKGPVAGMALPPTPPQLAAEEATKTAQSQAGKPLTPAEVDEALLAENHLLQRLLLAALVVIAIETLFLIF